MDSPLTELNQPPQALVIGPGGGMDLMSQFPHLDLSQVDGHHIAGTPLLLVDGSNIGVAVEIIRSIRQHSSPKVYLRPIVVVVPAYQPGTNNNQNLVGADAICLNCDTEPNAIEKLYQTFFPIGHWIASLPTQTDGDTNLALKTLRLISSRATEIVPQMTTERHQGFSHPKIEKFFQHNDHSLQQTMNYLVELKLLDPRFITRVHQCVHCHSAFLNFKETCPQCNAEELQVDELVHHFRCAHTAPMRDFQRDGAMVCPKCDQTLRHIGVDYDKPSISYTCQSCQFGFSDPQIMTSCFSCNLSTVPELLNHQAVFAYTTTSVGENAARHGIDNLFSSVVGDQLQLVSAETFNLFLRVEQARISRYGISNSSLMLICIEELEALYMKVGERAPELFGEIGEVFHRVLRQSDVITSRNDGFFVALLTETDNQQALRALERLHDGVQQLLSANLDHSPKIRDAVIAINDDFNYDELLEKFLDSTPALAKG
ncbi:MAG: hypothetical protein KUG54_01465 [Gammaproteobacteria bacterium]|nr:hypothetical protein [Gammaproteobacteria bacterium]